LSKLISATSGWRNPSSSACWTSRNLAFASGGAELSLNTWRQVHDERAGVGRVRIDTSFADNEA